MLSVNTNIASLNAQVNLNNNSSSLQTAIQRLSSGLRINSAKDDAAGYAISSRMTAQINGSNQAVLNANDGASLAQTAGGALATIADNLQSIRTLAVQAANASNSASDRATIQTQTSQLLAEIDSIAQSTSFNGVNLLDGSFTNQTFQVGANGTASNQINVSAIASAMSSQMGSAGSTTSATTTGTATTTALNAGDVTLNGQQVGASTAGAAPGQSAVSAYAIAQAINLVSANSGVNATANTTTLSATATNFGSVAANSFSINGINVGAIAAGTSVAGQGANVAAAINAVAAQTGVTATANATSGAVTLNAADGRDIQIASGYGADANTTNLDTTLKSKIGFAVGTGAALTIGNGAAATAGVTSTAATGTWTLGASQGTIAANTVSITTAAGTYALGAVDLTGTATQNAANLAAAIDAATGTTSGTKVATAVGAVLTTAVAFSVDVMGTAPDAATATANQGIVAAQFGTANGLATVGKQASAGTTTTTAAAVAAQTHGTVTLSSNNAAGIVIGGAADASAGLSAGTTAASTSSSVNAVGSINLSTAAGATSALAVIDAAINSVNVSAAALGALQNRFTSTVSNLQTTSQNLSAARSQIQDTDFAATTAAMTRGQILQQAGTAMLAQANSLPQSVLSLLK